MISLLRLTLVVTCLLVFTVQAGATIVLLSQERSVYGQASATDGADSDAESGTISAEDFTPFAEGIGFTISLDNALGSGSSTQDSEIATGAFSIHGSAAANGEAYEYDAWGEGSGISHFELLFEVPAPTPFVMSGMLAAYDNGSASLQLEKNGVPVLTIFTGYNEETPVAEEGELEPGAYRLTVRATASAWGDYGYYDYGFSSFDLEMVLENATPVGEDLVIGHPRLDIAPNPFSSATTISFRQAAEAPVRMTVYDLRGRQVRSFAGTTGRESSVSWDSRDDAGRRVSPGVYFVRVVSGDRVEQSKVTLVR